jgi:hypothetical protein
VPKSATKSARNLSAAPMAALEGKARSQSDQSECPANPERSDVGSMIKLQPFVLSET